MIIITTGTSKTAVTELMLTSVGANSVLAMASQNSVTIAPPKNTPGIIMIGFEVLVILPIR